MRVEKHLALLKRQRLIQDWSDRKIGPGREWEGQIDTHLNTAEVILPLISSDFIASEYCYGVEMKRAMDRHEAGEARVIPVILRPCDWETAPFAKLQALPRDAKPVTTWHNRDETFLSVAEGLRMVVNEFGPVRILARATVVDEAMEVYPPGYLTLDESSKQLNGFRERVEKMCVSDEALVTYVGLFFHHYRSTLERFFSSLTRLIPFYTNYPFHTVILRHGRNTVMIGHRPSAASAVRVVRPRDLDPPLHRLNVFDVMRRLEVAYLETDCSVRQYDAAEAEDRGKSRALKDALDSFWGIIDSSVFRRISLALLRAEGIAVTTEAHERPGLRFDAVGQVLLSERAGFRRFERWGFEFKHHRVHRVSAKSLREIEEYLDGNPDPHIDVVALITSGDLTSIGNHVAVKNPRIRVWDRSVLRFLVHQHLDTLADYFKEYAVALEGLSDQLRQRASVCAGRLDEFRARLGACPAGLEHFSLYQTIGVEAWRYLFPRELGPPRVQSATMDGKQRRDVLFRNQGARLFFRRIARKFGADFIIVDFKNYAEPVGPEVVDGVAKYADEAIGNLIVLVSRRGADTATELAQMRVLRDRKTMVLILSDADLLEMIARRERGENPEDLLEDILDEVLLRF